MRGFTLLELLLVIGISAIVGSAIFFNIAGFRNRNTLDLASQGLVSHLRDAQSRAAAQELSSNWGIHLENMSGDSDWYAIFYGNDYGSGIIHVRTVLSPSLEFRDPSDNSSKDIIFSKLSGNTASTSVRISLSGDENIFYIININANGVISYTSPE